MIKGINRQIIEITDTGNMYYEKAYLIVRPEYKNSQQALLDRQARQMLSSFKAPSALKKSGFIFYHVMRFLLFSGIGALLTILFFKFYY